MPEIKKYLNRDGLDEYNSLLPHSSGEMQTYVNDWLDEHPEATTTVQDGAITEPKLADKSVSLRTLADDTVHMLKGAILTGNLSGEVLTADDAYSAPPVALTVEGKSTQDGTPTPDAPVEIVNIEQVNLHFDTINVLLNLTQALRSLPNGTHDELSFAYLRPSTREGWAWYSQELTQRIGTVDMGTLTWSRNYAGLPYEKCWATVPGLSSAANGIACLCSHYRATTTAGATATMSDKTICKRLTYPMLMIRDTDYSSGPDLKASLNGVYVQYPLATPITTQLDPIELPFTAAPDFTIWNDPSTGLQIEYVRDSNIVIQNIEQAIADQ